MPSKPTRQSAIEKNDRRRTEIVETAIPIFATQGPDGVSLRDIAKAAGMKVGTLYYYFPEKQQLYEAAVDHALAHSSQTMLSGLRIDESPYRRLENIIDSHMTVFSSGNPIGALADRELLRVASDRSARMLTSQTIRTFRESQEAFKAIISEISGLPIDSSEVIWLEEFATSSIYGVARLYPWYEQTRSSRVTRAKLDILKANLKDSLIATFRGFGVERSEGLTTAGAPDASTAKKPRNRKTQQKA